MSLVNGLSRVFQISARTDRCSGRAWFLTTTGVVVGLIARPGRSLFGVICPWGIWGRSNHGRRPQSISDTQLPGISAFEILRIRNISALWLFRSQKSSSHKMRGAQRFASPEADRSVRLQNQCWQSRRVPVAGSTVSSLALYGLNCWTPKSKMVFWMQRLELEGGFGIVSSRNYRSCYVEFDRAREAHSTFGSFCAQISSRIRVEPDTLYLLPRGLDDRGERQYCPGMCPRLWGVLA